MTIEEAKRRIFSIRRQLLAIINYSVNNKGISKGQLKLYEKEIHELYNEYLKIYVQVCKKVPDFNNGYWPYNNNCYYYAMGLPTPKIFEDAYDKVSVMLFWNHLGAIAGLPYQERFTKEDVLEYLFADLDTLKIKWYESDIDRLPEHGGYKIALYFDENPNDQDYHFIRQNIDGVWSDKEGYDLPPKKILKPSKVIIDSTFTYDYIQTFEIVKPTSRR